MAKRKKIPASEFYDRDQEEFLTFRYKEKQYQKLAEILRKNLDLDMIYRILR